jgi:hypothetical protein
MEQIQTARPPRSRLWALMNRRLHPAVALCLDKAATSALSVALYDATEVRQKTGSYIAATASNLAKMEADCTFVGGSDVSKKSRTVSVRATATAVTVAARSDSGTCFFARTTDPLIRQRANTTKGPCSADHARGAGSPLWAG